MIILFLASIHLFQSYSTSFPTHMFHTSRMIKVIQSRWATEEPRHPGCMGSVDGLQDIDDSKASRDIFGSFFCILNCDAPFSIRRETRFKINLCCNFIWAPQNGSIFIYYIHIYLYTNTHVWRPFLLSSRNGICSTSKNTSQVIEVMRQAMRHPCANEVVSWFMLIYITSTIHTCNWSFCRVLQCINRFFFDWCVLLLLDVNW